MTGVLIALSVLPVATWLYLLRFHGRFWRADQRLEREGPEPRTWPGVVALIPARDEAETIARAVTSVLSQDYPGDLRLVLVDDRSEDDTADLAARAAARIGAGERLHPVRGETPPPGWAGKVWALEQGLRRAAEVAPEAAFLLLTDADIEHDPKSLRRLVAKALTEHLDLVSLMVLLHCRSQWEKLLIPAFVFFFQKLYPFPRVNDPTKRTAAAAGGCILVRRSAIARAGGLAAIRHELIDDCALARAVKSEGPIWLGLSEATASIRAYEGLAGIWAMVARSAYHQLGYSPAMLAATVLAMVIAYLGPPLAALGGALAGEKQVALLGIVAWLLMMRCYSPTLRLYGRHWLAGLDLPVAAFLYILMTIDSALRYRRGGSGTWKGRTYERTAMRRPGK